MDNEIETQLDPKRRKTFHQDSLPTLPNDHYTIALICALHIEMAAAQAILDEIHETPPRDADDTNSYVLGSIERHNIVIACLPAGQYGTVNAAAVATNLKRTFSGICMALMVGVGGGVPSKEHDIRLGDVVVGTRIMQYDLGKIMADGKFERTAIPRVQQPLLGTALNSLRAKHELTPSRVSSILQQKLESHPMYSRPSGPDRLFQATYEHESQVSRCDLCDQSKLESRSRRPPGTIKIHHGAIASGNQVIKYGTTRDNIAREIDVICFEMEAAGLMDIIPCLPIRGICDYSDSHKNKEWQRYAAATAAAYARELIEELPVNREHATVVFFSDQDHDTPKDRRQQLMKSLEFNQMKSRKVTIKKNLEKTCQWLLIHPDYKAWLDPAKLAHHHGFLWISGKPGAGKSTIMKFAYLKMKSIRGNGKIASFFFNARGESLEKSTSGMYRSLLLQLFQGYSDLQTVLDDPEISPQNQEGCPPLNILKDLFRNAVAGLGQRQFTCFIDALDECDEQQVMDMVEFFEDLGELARDQSIPLRICFSSRHYPYIVLRRGLRLTLEDQSGHEVDLATYITRRLRINDPLLIEELQPELLKKAAGVFMWVVLVVQILNDEDRQGGLALRKRLAEIPSDLSKLFKDILTRDKENMDSLLLCIRWILFAERPLQPEEFRHALWSGLSLKDMADSQIPAAIHAEDGENLNKIVISSSKGLAEITKSTSPTVQFIHESVRDFLIRDNGLHELWPGLEIEWESSSHEELKQCCHFYLNHPDVSILVEDILLGAIFYEQEDIQNKYPFLKYAIQNILYHANSAAEVVVQNGFLSNFPITSWMNMNNYFEIHRVRRYNSAANMLYILSDKGYSHLVRTRLQEDPSRDQEVEERYHFPLFAALANGHTDTVAALLNSTSCIENGVDITEGLRNRNNLKGYKNRTPLTWAAQEGRLGILKRLLKTESHVDAEDKDGYTALLLAIKNGHETMANLLIDEGADVNASHGDLGRPLALASLHGFVEVAKLLIDKGAHVSENHDTPLSLAFLKGNEAMVRRLIDKGADVDSMSVGGMRVLHYASMKGHEAIVRLLIDKGAYVDSMNAEGMRALHYASMNGHEAIVRRLIDKGADVDSMGVGGREALHHASKHGHEAIVRLLIDLGAYVDSMDAERMRALHHASMIGHEAIVRILVDKGADVNSMGVGRMKALHYASMIGHEAIVRLLIDKGAYVDSMNAERMRALHHASKHGHEAIVRLLVDKGADVNSRDWERMRALHYASMNGHEAIVRRLIDLGADVNSGDFLGKTAFDHASQNGHLAVTRLLIQMNNLN